MSKTPEELEKELAELKAKNAELEKNVENYKANAGGDESLKKRLEELEASNKSHSEENKKIKIENAKAKAISKYPFSAPFITAIVTDSPDEIEVKAKEFHEASQAQRDQAIKDKEAELASRWGQIPNGSVPGFMRVEDIDAEYKKSKDANDPQGMLKALWSKHIQGKK